MKSLMKKMSRLVLAFALVLTSVGSMSLVSAYPRAAGGTAQTVTEDAGNTLTPFNTSIGTTTAVAVYTKTGNRVDRVFRICNDQTATYSIVLSTSSSVTGVATTSTIAHDLVPPQACNEYVAPSQTMYGVFRSSATTGTFTGGRAFGFKRHDSRD